MHFCVLRYYYNNKNFQCPSQKTFAVSSHSVAVPPPIIRQILYKRRPMPCLSLASFPVIAHPLRFHALSEIIATINPNLLQFREVGEVKWPMKIVVEFRWSVNLHIDRPLSHVGRESSAHETIVPYSIDGHQVVSADLVTEQE